MGRTVTIEEQGREGRVTYHDGLHAIAGYQEFGGGDVVAIVSMGRADDWRRHHPWAVDRRAEILRFVADEVIRQRAPTCSASIDEASGDILLRSGAGTVAAGATRAGGASQPRPGPGAGDAAWVSRYGTLKGWLGGIGLIAALVVGAAAWVVSRAFMVQPGKAIPFGSTVRTDTHLATLIDRLQPYMASLHHDPSTERRTLSLLLVPLDGSAPTQVTLARDLRPGSYSLARIAGSDGRRLWIDANGTFVVDLRTSELIAADDAGPAPPRPATSFLSNPPLTLTMAAGTILGNGTWLGLQSTADLAGAYRAGRWLRPIESASDTGREVRRLTRGVLGPASSDDTHRQIRSMTALDAVDYRNASFLRLDERSEPLRVPSPESLVMLHTSGAGVRGTLLVSRVQAESGRVLWTHDTGLDRFTLEQILPGERSTAFVGTRPPIPDTLSEPLIVVLDHATGRLTTHSRWR